MHRRSETPAATLPPLPQDPVVPLAGRETLDMEGYHVLSKCAKDILRYPIMHPYQIFLELNDIQHRRTKVATPRTNGFVERFNRTVLDEFFREAFRKKFYASLEELQDDLDAWLVYYNTERPHRGYRNMGQRPVETFEQGKLLKEQGPKEALRSFPERD